MKQACSADNGYARNLQSHALSPIEVSEVRRATMVCLNAHMPPWLFRKVDRSFIPLSLHTESLLVDPETGCHLFYFEYAMENRISPFAASNIAPNIIPEDAISISMEVPGLWWSLVNE